MTATSEAAVTPESFAASPGKRWYVVHAYSGMEKAVELAKDKEMVMPGDNVQITVKLINPIAMEEGLRFAIREGGRTVGAGVVAKILE